MYKKTKFILMVIVLLFVTSLTSLVYAEEDLNSLRNALNNNSGIKYLKGQEKKELMDIIRDITNIVRIVVEVFLLLRLFKLSVYFRLAYDSPTVKSVIRIKAFNIFAGLIFAINFWNIFEFLAKLFNRI